MIFNFDVDSLIPFSAIYGDGLCTSGKRAYQVLVSNSLKVMVINSVGDFVLFLGKALIVAGSVGLGCKLLEVSFSDTIV